MFGKFVMVIVGVHEQIVYPKLEGTPVLVTLDPFISQFMLHELPHKLNEHFLCSNEYWMVCRKNVCSKECRRIHQSTTIARLDLDLHWIEFSTVMLLVPYTNHSSDRCHISQTHSYIVLLLIYLIWTMLLTERMPWHAFVSRTGRASRTGETLYDTARNHTACKISYVGIRLYGNLNACNQPRAFFSNEAASWSFPRVSGLWAA